MKTLIKSFALALSLGIVTSAATFAESNPNSTTLSAPFKTGIYTTTSGALKVAVDKETGGAVEIRLKDAVGNMLYSQHMGKKERNARVSLNLSELTDGVYTVEVSNGAKTTKQHVTISTTKLSVHNRLVAVN